MHRWRTGRSPVSNKLAVFRKPSGLTGSCGIKYTLDLVFSSRLVQDGAPVFFGRQFLGLACMAGVDAKRLAWENDLQNANNLHAADPRELQVDENHVRRPPAHYKVDAHTPLRCGV